MKDIILGKLKKSISCEEEIKLSDLDTTFSSDDLQLLIFGGGGSPRNNEMVQSYKAWKKNKKRENSMVGEITLLSMCPYPRIKTQNLRGPDMGVSNDFFWGLMVGGML